MSGHCIEKLSHTCGSSDGLQVFEEDGKYTGYCFACDTYVASPYQDGHTPPKKVAITKTPEQIAAEIDEISSCPSLDLPDRRLRKETLEYFGVKVGVSEEDGITPITRYYPVTQNGKLTGYKVKLPLPDGEKKFWAVGSIKGVDLFGWDQAIATGRKKLYITEGEDDALAVYQALKDKSRGTEWADSNPAVVSLVNGASSAKRALLENLPKLKQHFANIVLVFDNDDAGKMAVTDALQVVPTAHAVQVPGKDANACLIEGRAVALANCLLSKSETPKNTRLVWAEDLYDAAKEPAKFGLSWPWPSMSKHTRGIRFGETIYLGAGVKMGKSTCVDAIGTHMMKEHGLKIMLAKPEEANKKTIKKILGYATGNIFTDPTVPFDPEAYDRARDMIKNQFCMLNLYQHLDWSHLKQDITAAVDQGCKAIFIDPITNLTNGISSGEANTALQGIAQDFSAMALDLDFAGFIFCHLKSPDSGPPHEHGGEVLSNQFAGSRAMMRSCNYMIGLEGNKHRDLPPEQRNRRDLIILEDREFGVSEKVPLYYNVTTGLLEEISL